MLDELLEFEQIKKIPPKKNTNKANLKKVSSKNATTQQKTVIIYNPTEEYTQKDTYHDVPTTTYSMNRVPTLGDKVLMRKKKEEEKKRKAEIYKELHKNKKMNLHQFLSRVQNYEQKKKYNLELKKFNQLQKETASLQDKPKLSYNTLKICQTIPKEPLYKRTDDVLKEHDQEIKNLTIFYSMPKEVRERDTLDNGNGPNKNNKTINKYGIKNKKSYSVEVTRNNDDYESLQMIENKNKKTNDPSKKMTKQKSDEFFYKQEKWLKNKRARNQYFEKFYQIQNDTYSNVTFHPYVSQATLEILDIKNRLNNDNDDFYKYHIPNSYSQYNNLELNKGRTIWDKLYEEAGQKKNCCEEHSLKEFKPLTKKSSNRFRNISSKYFDLYSNPDKTNKKKRNNNINNSFDNNNKKMIKMKTVNNSFDNKYNLDELNNMNTTAHFGKKKENKRRSFYECDDINEYNYYKMKQEKEKFHWRNSLLKIKPPVNAEINDYTYHLNVMQTSAWNDNFVNKVTFDGNAKARSVINLMI